MTRLQTVLLLVVIALASVIAGQTLWPVLEGGLARAAATILVVVQSTPEWVWWTAFGSIWWLPHAFGAKGRGCASSCSTTKPSAS